MAVTAGYEALVVLGLNGGMDYANTVISYDQATYDLYAAARPNLKRLRNDLTPTLLTPITPLAGGKQYALAPELAGLMPAWNAGDLAVILNIGNLIDPATKLQWTNQSVRFPSQVFSHNDQDQQVKCLLPAGAVSGWGGRIGDALSAENTSPQFTCTTVAGVDYLLNGVNTSQYAVGFSGPQALFSAATQIFNSSAAMTALQTGIRADTAKLIGKHHARIMRRSLDSYGVIRSAIDNAPAITVDFGDYVHNSISRQFRLIVQLMTMSAERGVKKEVFYLGDGGYDHHSGLAAGLPLKHTAIAFGMSKFREALIAAGLNDQVTTMVLSEFGRAMKENLTGTDHGYGTHTLVMGGKIKGKEFHGNNPVFGDNGVNDVGEGRLLPTTPYEYLGVPFATRLGVSGGQMATVFPNYANFPATPLDIYESGGGGVFYDTDAAAFFARIPTAMSTASKTAVNAFIAGLKADTIWPKVGGLWLGQNNALLNVPFNLKANTIPLTRGGNPGFTAFGHVAGTGSLNDYFSLPGGEASVPGFVQSDAHIGMWIQNDTGNAAIAHRGGPYSTFVAANANNPDTQIRILGSNGVGASSNPTVGSFVSASLLTGDELRVFDNGALVASNTAAATGASAAELFIYNGAVGAGARWKILSMGAALTNAQHAAYSARVTTLLAALTA